MKKIVFFFLLISFVIYSISSYADDTKLHPITWKGKKWEYLAEYPSDIQHVDVSRFEEIMDTAGQHGWRLVTVSHEYHFYVFFFTRPLLPEKLKTHRARLKQIKDERGAKEEQMQAQVESAYKERLQLEGELEQQVQKTNKELKQEIQLEKQVQKK